MNHIRILLLIILVFSPLQELKAQDELQIIKKGKKTVVGNALNARAGAVIVTENDSTYYIAGMDSWKAKYYGKTISVTGFYVIEKRTYEVQYYENGEEKLIDHLPPIMPILKRPRRIRIVE